MKTQKEKQDTNKLFKIAYLKYNRLIENGSFYLNLITDEDLKVLDTEDRWSLHCTHVKENINSHTNWVNIFTWVLCKKQGYDEAKTGRALTFSTFHDFDEIFTGDLNHKFKYDFDNGVDIEQVKKYAQKKVKEKLMSFGISKEDIRSTFTVEDEIKLLVKLADWLSALQFLSFELFLGNNTLKVKKDFVYCLIGVCKAIQDFSVCKNIEETDSDLARLFLDLRKINNLLYGG